MTEAEVEKAASARAALNKSLPVNMQEYTLLKKRAGCSGMFWRPDPTGKTQLASNNDWPHDGAMMKGEVVEAKGAKWLLVSEVKQSGGTDWVKAPVGAAMPFEYDNHYYLG
jgi:hypothetical protein